MSRHTVLVVEDEPAIRVQICLHLEASGFQTMQTESAEEAIGLLRRFPEIDLVFSDIRMRGKLDGADLVRWAKAHRPDVVLMIGTGYVDLGEAIEQEEGLKTFLKPYNYEKIARQVRETLGQNPGAQTG